MTSKKLLDAVGDVINDYRERVVKAERRAERAPNDEFIIADLTLANEALRQQMAATTSASLSSLGRDPGDKMLDLLELRTETLESIEWVEVPRDRAIVPRSGGVCPSCWAPRPSGHNSTCRLHKALEAH